MRALALLMIVSVAGMSLLASLGYGPALFGFVNRIPGGDKTGHFVLMGLLAFAVTGWLAPAPWRGGPVGMVRATALVVALVTLEELLQLLVPVRRFTLTDLLASYAGILTGALAGSFALKRRRPNDAG